MQGCQNVSIKSLMEISKLDKKNTRSSENINKMQRNISIK